MTKQIVNEVWNAIYEKVYGLVPIEVWDWLYIGRWYLIGLAILLAIAAIRYLLPFHWVSVVGAWLSSLVVVALWAATMVFRHDQAERKLREKIQTKKEPTPKQAPSWPW